MTIEEDIPGLVNVPVSAGTTLLHCHVWTPLMDNVW